VQHRAECSSPFPWLELRSQRDWAGGAWVQCSGCAWPRSCMAALKPATSACDTHRKPLQPPPVITHSHPPTHLCTRDSHLLRPAAHTQDLEALSSLAQRAINSGKVRAGPSHPCIAMLTSHDPHGHSCASSDSGARVPCRMAGQQRCLRSPSSLRFQLDAGSLWNQGDWRARVQQP
jgi:hypothetical protein